MATWRLSRWFQRVRWARLIRAGLAATVVVGFGGCQRILARLIVYAPNHGWHPTPTAWAATAALDTSNPDAEWRIRVGPPDAELAFQIIDPPYPNHAAARELRGTILILHGIYASKEHMRPVADLLAAAGYRSVLVDLRGHGHSTGDWLTYGVVESRDLSQVIDALNARRLIAGCIGVYGASYGGGIAIQWAGRDPRIDSVVAVAAFASLKEVVPSVAELTLPSANLLSDEFVRQTIVMAGQLADFDPEEADNIAAIRRTHAAVLLFHGDRDAKIPCSQSYELAEAAGAKARYIELFGEDHTSIMGDRDQVIANEMVAWFNRHLTAP